MMNCNEINEWISLYIDHELDGEQLAEFEAHIAGCEDCRREVEEISRLVNVCADIGEEELPEGFEQALHQKLLAAGAKEQPEKKLLIFPLRQLKLVASIAAGFAVVVIAAFLIKGMLLTPSKMDNSTGSLAMADRRMSKAENALAADAAGGSTEAAASGAADAGAYSIAGTENGTNPDVTLQFSEAIPGESNETRKSAAQFGGTEPKAPTESKTKTGAGASGSRGDTAVETTAVEPAPNMVVTALKMAPEKKVAGVTVRTDDIEKASNGLVQLLLDNGGEKVETPAGMMSIETTKTDNSTVLSYRIPNENYTAFTDAAVKAYGKDNVKATEPANEDLTTIINDLQKQSDDLATRIQQAENKAAKLTAEELQKLKEEKKIVDTRLEAVRSELNFTYITLTIQQK